MREIEDKIMRYQKEIGGKSEDSEGGTGITGCILECHSNFPQEYLFKMLGNLRENNVTFKEIMKKILKVYESYYQWCTQRLIFQLGSSDWYGRVTKRRDGDGMPPKHSIRLVKSMTLLPSLPTLRKLLHSNRLFAYPNGCLDIQRGSPHRQTVQTSRDNISSQTHCAQLLKSNTPKNPDKQTNSRTSSIYGWDKHTTKFFSYLKERLEREQMATLRYNYAKCTSRGGYAAYRRSITYAFATFEKEVPCSITQWITEVTL